MEITIRLSLDVLCTHRHKGAAEVGLNASTQDSNVNTSQTYLTITGTEISNVDPAAMAPLGRKRTAFTSAADVELPAIGE
jgi:hypothetical protein